jgi:hypothetical protein
MSETTEQTGADAAQTQTAVDNSGNVGSTDRSNDGSLLDGDQSASQSGDGTGTTEPSTEQQEQLKPEPKPKRTDRHIAHLTARAAEEQRLREAAEKRAEAAEALLRVNRQGDDEQAPQQPRQLPVDIDARAEQLLQEREFTRRLGEIDATGKKELGADAWEQAKATLTGLGAVNNQAFLQALAEAENPHKLFANLADDPDTLMELLQRPAPAMAARIGRMDAELSRPAAKPLSAAPIPATRVQGGAVTREFDPYNPPAGMSMKAWNAEMDKYLPPSLGGKRKSA